MYAGDPVLDPVNVEAPLGQLDLLPLQVADLRRPQAMAVGDQDHGRIPMPVGSMLSGAVHQSLDLALGEVSPLDCQVYDAWGAFLGCRFHVGKPCLRACYCICYTPFLNSQLRLPSRSRPINRGRQSAGIFPHRDAETICSTAPAALVR